MCKKTTTLVSVLNMLNMRNFTKLKKGPSNKPIVTIPETKEVKAEEVKVEKPKAKRSKKKESEDK